MVFVDPCPFEPGSHPIILDSDDSSNDQPLSELDIFRVLGSIFTHGCKHLFPHLSSANSITPEMFTLLQKCFRATGFDFLYNPSPSHPLISKCLPTGGAPRCIKIPTDASKTDHVTVLFHPII